MSPEEPSPADVVEADVTNPTPEVENEFMRGASSASPVDAQDGAPSREAFFCWLIEAPGQHYLAIREAPRMFYAASWTKDHEKALRFNSEAEADGVMMLLRQYDPALFAFARTLGDARPVEHGWVGR